MSTETRTDNADPGELAKFSALAHRWWDPKSEFRPLHEINPLRLAHIERLAGGLAGKRIPLRTLGGARARAKGDAERARGPESSRQSNVLERQGPRLAGFASLGQRLSGQ